MAISEPETPFQSRMAALQAKVNAAALALHEQGIRPTVARIRAALGGGSPNELTPAVRHWREGVLPTLQPLEDESSRPPPQVADLMRELWTRAAAAAVIDKRGGEAAILQVARSEEAHALRQQVSALRDQLEREAISYGELRAQAARHEAIAKEALGRVREIEERERNVLYRLGEAKQRIAELEAAIDREAKASPRPPAARRSRPTRPAKPASRRKERAARSRKPKKRSTKTRPRTRGRKRR
ncbi:MAG: DNA-binding protein [Cyanobacteria bacterium SZAS LIN-2]|nr:DNA-binding protein [Cyanobacteria bacterium SZAS LIN-2]